MRGWLRSVCAGLTTVALLAALAGLCPCPAAAGQAEDAHGCCVPAAGLRSAAPSCCGAGALGDPVAADRPASVEAAPQAPAVAVALPVPAACRAAWASVPAAKSPRASVLRI